MSSENQITEQLERDIEFLGSFSCDVISSRSLARTYDSLALANAIDRCFGQYGVFSGQNLKPIVLQHIQNLKELEELTPKSS